MLATETNILPNVHSLLSFSVPRMFEREEKILPSIAETSLFHLLNAASLSPPNKRKYGAMENPYEVAFQITKLISPKSMLEEKVLPPIPQLCNPILPHLTVNTNTERQTMESNISYCVQNVVKMDKPSSPRRDEPTVKSPSHEQGDNSFKCSWDNCNQIFSTRTGLATHSSSHLVGYISTGQKRSKVSYTCKWGNCNREFETVKQMCKHLAQMDHVGQTPFLPKQENVKEVKTSKKQYACSYPGCGRIFNDSSNRKKHERTHDANRERFFCTEDGCKKSYSTKTDLSIHMKVHKGEFTHKCTHPNCSKAFVRLSELYAHERTHDNILPHLCNICGKRFREKSRLRIHEESHEQPQLLLQLANMLE